MIKRGAAMTNAWTIRDAPRVVVGVEGIQLTLCRTYLGAAAVASAAGFYPQ